jgi:hypothetical protein
MADVKKIIKDLAGAYGDSNENQGKMVQILKGLAFSDDPKANEFMKALDKWTTSQSKKMFKENTSKLSTETLEIVEIKEEIKIGKTVLEKGDKIKILTESMDFVGDAVDVLKPIFLEELSTFKRQNVGIELMGSRLGETILVLLGSEIGKSISREDAHTILDRIAVIAKNKMS